MAPSALTFSNHYWGVSHEKGACRVQPPGPGNMKYMGTYPGAWRLTGTRPVSL